MLPGANNVAGLWPAVWTMGNLGMIMATIFFLLINLCT